MHRDIAMAITSDNSSPPSTSSESIQSKEVQLHDNGVLAGTAVANPNGAWQLMLNNLTEGSHIMTASSGGTTSNQWAVNVSAASGNEDWADIPEQVFGDHTFYVCKSGLILVIFDSKAPYSATKITTLNYKKVLAVGPHGSPSAVITEFGLLLPAPATRIKVNVAQKFRPYDISKITFFGDNNFVIPYVLSERDGDVGEHVYPIGIPVRLVRWTCRSYDGSPFNFSSISWSND